MIDFELSEGIQTQRQMVHAVAEQAMRPIAREYDEREHEKPWDFLNMMWQVSSGNPVSTGGLMAAEKSDGFVVVWATLDRSAGRAGIKAFVVEAGTPGMYVTKVENKLGIRASDTATLVFEDCRVPLDNILGSPEVPKTS